MSGTFHDGFEGSIPQTADDRRVAIQTGLLSIDANVLLNFYRYNAKARDALVDVFRAAGDRVWISHQATREFWRNRMRVIDDRTAATTQLTDSLDKSRRSVQSALANWAKQTAVPNDVTAALADGLDDAVAQMTARVAQESTDAGTISYDTATDAVVELLSGIFHGKVGSPLSEVDHREAVAEGKRRIELSEPPGYMDAQKEDSDSTDGGIGDYLVWKQSLLEAAERQIPLVVVTGDEKDDWWWRHRGRPMGPRAELVAECRAAVGHELYMLRPIDLIENADTLDVAVTEEARNDVELKSEPAEEVPSAPWTRWATGELLQRLEAEGRIQAKIIRAAAANDGEIDRAEVFRIAGYAEDRMLKGFTRPSARITRDLQEEGLVELGVTPVLVPMYEGGVIAQRFVIPPEMVEFLTDGRPLRRVRITRDDLPEQAS